MTAIGQKPYSFLCITLLCLVALPECTPGNSRPINDPINLVIDLTGNIAGTVEPCGCVKGQLGGLARRARIISDARKQYRHNYLYFEYGNLLYPDQPSTGFDHGQRLLRARTLAQGAGTQGLDALNLTVQDLQLGIDETIAMLRSARLPVVSANLRGSDRRLLAPSHISFNRAGLKIAVTGIAEMPATTGTRLPDGLQVDPPVDALATIVPSLRETHDMVIVLSNATSITHNRIAERFGPILVAGAAYDTMGVPTPLPKGSFNIGATTLGRHVARINVGARKDASSFTLEAEGALTPEDSPVSTIRPELIPVDAKLNEDREIRRVINQMKDRMIQEAIAQHGRRAAKAIADERPVFAGAKTCVSCHQLQHEYWSKHPHAHAMETLEDVKSHTDTTCIGCHSLGFNEPGGYEGSVVPEFFRNVQCESCHGPAAAHVADPLSARPDRIVSNDKCLKCHGAFHEQKPFDAAKMKQLATCPSAGAPEVPPPYPSQEPDTGE